MNKAVFFQHVRDVPFGKVLTQQNVDGLNAIIDYRDKEWPKVNDRMLAYILATVFHETAGTMQPIAEYGKGKGRSYGVKDPETGKVYYGRGYVQLTWKHNYKTMGNLIGVDLVSDPDRALRKDVALVILFEGMMRGASSRGDFTGRALEQFFSGPIGSDEEEKKAATSARAIINGKDKAAQIAVYYLAFLRALVAAKTEMVATPVPDPVAKGTDLIKSKTVLGSIASGAAGIIGSIIQGVNNPWAFAIIALVILVGVGFVIYGRVDLRYRTGS